MKQQEKVALIGVAIIFVLLLFPSLVSGQTPSMNAAQLIASFEGFSAVPYWDVSRWSWGYGTQAPGSSGTITEAEAMQALMDHAQIDYDYLKPLVTRELRPNQWAALLSFSYNEGPGNADNLIDNINSGDDQALGAQWMLYNKVRDRNGNLVFSQTLADRRAKEFQIWQS